MQNRNCNLLFINNLSDFFFKQIAFLRIEINRRFTKKLIALLFNFNFRDLEPIIILNIVQIPIKILLLLLLFAQLSKFFSMIIFDLLRFLSFCCFPISFLQYILCFYLFSLFFLQLFNFWLQLNQCLHLFFNFNPQM